MLSKALRALIFTLAATFAAPLDAQLATFTLEDVELPPLDGRFVPGESYRYLAVVEADAATGPIAGATFRLPVPLPDLTTIVPGTATTTQGIILSGSGAGDRELRVDLGTLVPGSPATLTLDVRIDPTIGTCTTTLTTQARLTAPGIKNQRSIDPEDGTDFTDTSLEISVSTAQTLLISDTNGDRRADPGELLVVTADMSFSGNGLAAELAWRLASLSHAALVPGTVSVDDPAAVVTSGNDPGDTTVRVSLPGPFPSASMRLRFELLVDDPPPLGATEVSVSGQIEIPCVVSSPATETLPLAPTFIDLVLSKTDSGASALPGELLSYRLGLRNAGNVAASGVVVVDVLPEHTRFEASGSDPAWTCTSDPGATCTLLLPGPLGPAETVLADLAVLVDSRLPAGVETLSNTATVSDDGSRGPDQNPADNSAAESTPVVAAPDLIVTKSDGGASAIPAKLLSYTVSVENRGDQDATGVTLRETVPEHTVFAPGPSDSGWVCEATAPGSGCALQIPALGAGAGPRSFAFALRVDPIVPAAAEQITNTVSVSDDGANGPDPNPDDNAASEVTPLLAAPDLAIRKSADLASVQAGETLSYSVSVENLGDQDATGVTLQEIVPQQTRFDRAASDPAWACEAASAGSLCLLELALLPAGEPPRSFAFAVQVDETIPAGVTEITNRVSVRDDGTNGPDPDPSNDSDATSTPLVAAPDLVITKDDGGVTVRPGELLSYTISIENLGSQDATGVEIEDLVPDATTFVATSSDPSWSCESPAAGSRCTLALPQVLAGARAQGFAFAVRLDETVPAELDEIQNDAAASDDGENGPDPTPDDNQASELTPVDAAVELVLLKSASVPSVNAGELLSFTLAVSNTGDRDARGVELTDAVPENTTFDAGASDPAWTCPALDPGSPCTLDVGGVAAGEPARIFLFTLRVEDPLAAGVVELSNLAVAADDDGHEAEDSAVVPIDPATGPLLSVTKSSSQTSVNAGELLSFKLTLQNVGNQDTTGAVLSEIVPLHTVFDAAASDPGWTCSGTAPGSACFLDVGPLPAAEPASSFLFALRVDPTLPPGVDAIANTVVASDDGGNEDQDSTVVPIDPDTQPELVLTKDDGVEEVNAGERLIYTLAFRNTGTLGASGVVLFETVPEHTTFVASKSDPAWVCSATAPGASCELLIGDLPAGVPRTAAFAVELTSPLPAGVSEIRNTAIVTDDAGHAGKAVELTPIAEATAPDLAVTKDDGSILANPGDLVTYTITVENLGVQDASGVLLTDVVPEHTDFVAPRSDPGWACGDTTCILLLELLPAGSPARTFELAVRVVSPLPAGVVEILNTVSVTDDGSSGKDLDPSDNLAIEITPLDLEGGTGPDLRVTKSDGDVLTGAGELLLYTLDVANGGNQDATGVEILETVPEHTTFDAEGSARGWICDAVDPGSSCRLALGKLAAGNASPPVSFAVRVDEPLDETVTEILNTVSVTDDGSGGQDLDPTNNAATEVTPIEDDGRTGPDLRISKSDGDVLTRPGELLRYTLEVANGGNRDAAGVEILETVPENTRFDRQGSDPRWICEAEEAGSRCRLPIGAILPDASSRRTVFVVRVDERLDGSVEAITNTVSVTDDGSGGPDLDPTNNTVTEVTPLVLSDEESILYASKTDTVVGPEIYGVEGGLVVEYLVLVENLGTVTVPELRFEPHADPATVYLEGSATAPEGRVEEIDGSFVVSFGELTPGAVFELGFAVHLAEPFPPFLTRIECQGSFTSPGIPQLLTDDPETPEPLDPTVTRIDAPPAEPVEIPTLSSVGFAGLIVGLAWIAVGTLRRRL